MTTLRRHSLVSGAIGLILSCPVAFALEVPVLQGRVNDLARMMGHETSSQLEKTLGQFEEQTRHQIAVLTIPSLNGDNLEDFSIRVAEAWKVGHSGADDGVILIIARDDRKIRIEVGYGLEGVLPDAIANRIIQDVIVPRFRDRDFDGGIESGVAAIVQAARGEPVSVNARPRRGYANLDLSTILLTVLGAGLVGSVVGFAQPSPLRGALNGAFASGLLCLPGIFALGSGMWVVAILVGALASIFTVSFTRRAWGRSWNVRPSRRYDFSPRDTFQRGYGAGGSGGADSSGSGGTGSSGFGGGGGGFGGGGASGGW